MDDHKTYIQRCFDLAIQGGKHVASNPHVGSVIVYNNRIIGEGWHKKKGGPHAEVNAVNSVADKDKYLLAKSTIYVSLEPCNHTGLTPPCTSLILKHKIPKVCVSIKDPNPLMSGKSLDLLRKNGVEIIDGLLEEKGSALIRPFVICMQKKRPYTIIKFACSKDHFMGQNDQQVWISNPYAKILSHQWRAEHDAIIIGAQTAITDNPKLTTRLHEGEHPLRIVIDPNDRVPRTHHLWTDEHPTWFIRASERTTQNDNRSGSYKQEIEISSTDFEEELLRYLYKRNLYRIMIEGGRKTIDRFVHLNLWDECRMIRSSEELKTGIKAPNITGKLQEKYNLEHNEIIVFMNENA